MRLITLPINSIVKGDYTQCHTTTTTTTTTTIAGTTYTTWSSLNFFIIHFCIIRGLRSNFQSVENHLSSTKPHLFLTDAQLSEATDSSPFSVPSYFWLTLSFF
ncbi:hypothetical protein E2C01_048740 [Portunus trituberculatus]|uniref:Uncharacterized protein n=1 Tax=Portunus trituberculatus TaxID=210409 RepID=A0A5B7GE73_PORTR|nr:hypothetical protein [Portunus trituberculatus]